MLAIYIDAEASPQKTQFMTTPVEPLQCGIGVFKKGGSVEPHRHVGMPAVISEFQEFIFIRKGRAIADVFDPEGMLVTKLDMGPGDALLLLRGGHGFYFPEDTELLEIKQGPYLGREKMKDVFVTAELVPGKQALSSKPTSSPPR